MRLASTLAASALAIAAATSTAEARWLASWESAIAALDHPIAPGQTIRQFARISVGGSQVRVRISNETGTKPLRVADAHVAMADNAPGTVKTSTDHALTFHGGATATIAPGASMLSDPVDMAVPSLSRLAVSAVYASASPVQVGHLIASEDNYLAPGDHAAEAYMQGSRVSVGQSGYYLSGISVTSDVGAVVACMGDSITDGLDSTANLARRWPDRLADRMATSRPNVGVIDAGITGNALTADGPSTFGPAATARFQRDVLSRPGVRWVILLEGINDIIGATDATAAPTAQAMIQGYREIVDQAHDAGVKVLAGTILPFGGADPQYYTATRDNVRQTVNDWIRTSGAFDEVIDFDAVMRAPGNLNRLRPSYDSGDHIHPNDAGYQAMANAVVIGNLR